MQAFQQAMTITGLASLCLPRLIIHRSSMIGTSRIEIFSLKNHEKYINSFFSFKMRRIKDRRGLLNKTVPYFFLRLTGLLGYSYSCFFADLLKKKFWHVYVFLVRLSFASLAFFLVLYTALTCTLVLLFSLSLFPFLFFFIFLGIVHFISSGYLCCVWCIFVHML